VGGGGGTGQVKTLGECCSSSFPRGTIGLFNDGSEGLLRTVGSIGKVK